MPVDPHGSPSFAHGIGMRCTRCFSAEEPGAIRLLYVRSAEQEGEAAGQEELAVLVSNSCQRGPRPFLRLPHCGRPAQRDHCPPAKRRSQGPRKTAARSAAWAAGARGPADQLLVVPGSLALEGETYGKTRLRGVGQPPAPAGTGTSMGQ